MLQSYQAELQGSQLIWLGEAPKVQGRERVLVVLERPERQANADKRSALTQAFTASRGCMGQSNREAVLQQLDGLRQDWQRE